MNAIDPCHSNLKINDSVERNDEVHKEDAPGVIPKLSLISVPSVCQVNEVHKELAHCCNQHKHETVSRGIPFEGLCSFEFS
ncbi:hypothetical protein ACHAWT_008060 [Skeletonema menzelii]